MQKSGTTKHSNHAVLSPDGKYIATIQPLKLSLRETSTLRIKIVLPLPSDVSVTWLRWSPSSTRILVGSSDILLIFSVTDVDILASIKNPNFETTKITSVFFGASDDEILFVHNFGVKLSIFSLLSSEPIDIPNIKFFSPVSILQGCCFRPGTANLTLLTRTNGKDIISIHSRGSLQIVRSWCPKTIDAQAFSWSADGRWLAISESACQDYKIFVYTADGHLYKTWQGKIETNRKNDSSITGIGIKLFEWSPNSSYIAIGDYSQKVTILIAPSFSESFILFHSTAVTPTESCIMWLEVIDSSHFGCRRELKLATQTVHLPLMNKKDEIKAGANFMKFDRSGKFLATKMEETPTTVWIWDMTVRTIREVFVLESPICKISWHPITHGLLMFQCEGDDVSNLVYLWEQTWPTPKLLDLTTQITGGNISGKQFVVQWLMDDPSNPSIYVSESDNIITIPISKAQA
ncbi:WD40 domain protein [Blumeria hordei DH14]|uniref:WD40 domain protein n=1 Tax=Blumeria graminis f. sp. hordei (strain DH14) TaxID=546991 RepID=N1JKD5_BLUG1|nr:WD40 domain protein [Blumeria hordei DH14]